MVTSHVLVFALLLRNGCAVQGRLLSNIHGWHGNLDEGSEMTEHDDIDSRDRSTKGVSKENIVGVEGSVKMS
jgi:hypothetical protein